MAVGKIYTNKKTAPGWVAPNLKPKKPKPITGSIKSPAIPYVPKKKVKMTGTSAKGRNIAR